MIRPLSEHLSTDRPVKGLIKEPFRSFLDRFFGMSDLESIILNIIDRCSFVYVDFLGLKRRIAHFIIELYLMVFRRIILQSVITKKTYLRSTPLFFANPFSVFRYKTRFIELLKRFAINVGFIFKRLDLLRDFITPTFIIVFGRQIFVLGIRDNGGSGKALSHR